MRIFSMNNEGTDFITLYGIKVGDFIDDAEKILLNNDWVNIILMMERMFIGEK